MKKVIRNTTNGKPQQTKEARKEIRASESCGGRTRARPEGTLRSAKNCDREHVKSLAEAKRKKPENFGLLRVAEAGLEHATSRL